MPLESAPYSIIFVCSGNICRSPAAECVFRARAGQAGIVRRLVIDSAGTHGLHEGEPPDPRSARVLSRAGYRVEGLARELRKSDFDPASAHDLFVCMDRTHERHVLRAGAHPDRVVLLRSFDPSGEGGDLPDPYYGGADGFDAMLEMIERSMAGLLARVERELAEKGEC